MGFLLVGAWTCWASRMGNRPRPLKHCARFRVRSGVWSGVVASGRQRAVGAGCEDVPAMPLPSSRSSPPRDGRAAIVGEGDGRRGQPSSWSARWPTSSSRAADLEAAARPRWVWWSAAADAAPLVVAAGCRWRAAGTSPRRTASLAGGWEATPQVAWAAAHRLDRSGLPEATRGDLFDFDAGSAASATPDGAPGSDRSRRQWSAPTATSTPTPACRDWQPGRRHPRRPGVAPPSRARAPRSRSSARSARGRWRRPTPSPPRPTSASSSPATACRSTGRRPSG